MRQTSHLIISVFFIALLLFIAYEVVLIVSPFLQPLFWAAVIAFGFYPLHLKIRDAVKNETLAAGLTTLIVLLTFVPLVTFILFSLASEGFKFYQWAIEFVRTGGLDRTMNEILSHPSLQRVRFLFRWNVVRDNYEAWFSTGASTVGNLAAKQVGALTKNTVLFFLHFFLAFFLLFFFLRDGKKISGIFYELIPLEEKNKSYLYRQIKETFAAVIHGQLLTAAAQAVIAGVIFWALGIPLPIFFAAVTLIVALIPVVGAPFVWLPLVGYLAATGSHGKAAILFFLGVFVISLVDNFLKPILIGEKTKLPYIVLFLGILGGIQVYGLLGIFLAPAILSLFFALIKIYREKYL
jgi:predicted PurR-regulated permease PerM